MDSGLEDDASIVQGRDGRSRGLTIKGPRGATAAVAEPSNAVDSVAEFTEAYASFNRIINSLQRKYIELEDEFTTRNDQLAEANRKLVDLSECNLAATEFLNGILNSISAGVIAVDDRRRITHANPAAAAILGYTIENLVGSRYDEVLGVGDPAEASALKTAMTGEEVASVEKESESSDGRRLFLSVSTSLLRDRQGRRSGAVEVFQDLTKIKKMEQDLARLNTLAALGEMAATVAHEVRNPLAGIAGFAALLERDLDETDPCRRTVKKIIRGVEALNNTVGTLLDYTRFKELNRMAVDYGQFLEDAIERFQQDNADRLERVTIEYNEARGTAAPKVRLSIDRVLMRQVLYNIMSNATDMMNEEGRIRIEHRVVPVREAVERYGQRVLLGSDETIVETTICDNGPGIHEHHRERIFAPFFSTRAGGNGLGLAVVWKILKAHGGEVFTTDAPGSGACFHLLLPARIETASMEQGR
jgi:PAS domain S-box-containing protein